jgi:uncharacterized protein (TIGR02246 family)
MPNRKRRDNRAAHVKAIRKSRAEFVAAWNSHDAKRIASFWDEEGGDFVDPTGLLVEGRAKIERLEIEAHSTVFKEARLSSPVKRIRFAKENVAVVDGSYKIVNAKAGDGRSLPPLDGLYSTVLLKRGGKWRYFAHRAMETRRPFGE